MSVPDIGFSKHLVRSGGSREWEQLIQRRQPDDHIDGLRRNRFRSAKDRRYEVSLSNTEKTPVQAARR